MEDAKPVWNTKQDFSKFYSPSEHLAVDEVIVLFKERVIFRQYITKKSKCFGFNIYKTYEETGYTYTVYSFLDGGEETSYMDFRFSPTRH
jgi:hypothetical protein